MRVFYENLVGTIENYYSDKATVENVLYLEDIINTTTTDIYVQYREKTSSQLTYADSNIELNGMLKCRNHLYFINYYKSTYNDYQTFNTNADNTIKLIVTNVNISKGVPYTLQVWFNDKLIETLEYEDEYTLYNTRSIQFDSTTLDCPIVVTWPLYLSVGDNIQYKIYTINVTEKSTVHKYLCTYDRVNNALIFDRKYPNYNLCIALQSKGSILRASTINELLRVNGNAFVQYDENTNKLIIPTEKIFKSGSTLKYIKSQWVIIDPVMVPSGYSLLGVYLNGSTLAYDVIITKPNYSSLIQATNNFTLDTQKKTREYYGFILGQCNINKFTPLDVNMYGLGAGSGSGGGSAEKIQHEVTDIETLEVEYAGGTQVPFITIFDTNGQQVIPQNTHYNLNDKITVTFGEHFSG